MSETVHDAIRGQLIEAMAENDAFYQHCCHLEELPADAQDALRQRNSSRLVAALAVRDSDGIPLVLGLIARPVVLSGGHYPDEGGPTVWVPRLSGGAA